MGITGRGGAAHSYLVTGTPEQRIAQWRASCTYANWLETRDQTTHVMIFAEQAKHFLEAARMLRVTVQIIEGAVRK